MVLCDLARSFCRCDVYSLFSIVFCFLFAVCFFQSTLILFLLVVLFPLFSSSTNIFPFSFTFQARGESKGAQMYASALDHLNEAWDLYYVVFRKINRLLPQASTCNLSYPLL